MSNRYPAEVLDEDDDNGTMPVNVAKLTEHVVGHRIVTAEPAEWEERLYGGAYTERRTGLVITLDNGTRVRVADTSDCCAYTTVRDILLHIDRVEHVITGVGTTDEYTKWHIYADLGDVLELSVEWSCGNPFYYAYGFDITVEPDVIVVTESAPRRAIGAGETAGEVPRV